MKCADDGKNQLRAGAQVGSPAPTVVLVPITTRSQPGPEAGMQGLRECVYVHVGECVKLPIF